MNIYVYLTAIIALILAIVAAAMFAPRALRLFRELQGERIAAKLIEQAERVALDAIAFAEERARGASKAGHKLTGSAKMNLAIAFFREHASRRIREWLGSRVGDWIEAKLGMLRGLPGLHAVGTVATIEPAESMVMALEHEQPQ